MDISFNKCGIAMASSGNRNREIQLIIVFIDDKMCKGKYLVGMLSAHPGGAEGRGEQRRGLRTKALMRDLGTRLAC